MGLLGHPLKIFLDLNAFAGKPKGPGPETMETIAGWTHEQMDVAIDVQYAAFASLFTEGTSQQLHRLAEKFDAGQLRIDAGTFLHTFKLDFVQHLCNQNPAVANYMCEGPTCKDGFIIRKTITTSSSANGTNTADIIEKRKVESNKEGGNSNTKTQAVTMHWKSNLPQPALEYLQSLSVSWEDFFLGKHGWDVNVKTYKCRKSCKFWLHWGLHERKEVKLRKRGKEEEGWRSVCPVQCDGPKQRFKF